jgi:signal transduction histidine kinase
LPFPEDRDQAAGALRLAVRHEAIDFAITLGENVDLDQRQNRLVRLTSQLLQVECVLFAFDHADNKFSAVAASDTLADSLAGLEVSVEPGLGGLFDPRNLREFDPGELLPYCTNPERLRRVLALGRSIAVPLSHRHEILGNLLMVTPGRARLYTPEEVALMRKLAQLGAISIHTALLYRNALRSTGRMETLLARMSQVRDHERKAFASLVHDDILQPMAGAVYALEALREAVEPDARHDFDHIVHLLRMSIEDARKVIWEIRPAVLDGLGLSEALGLLADRVAVEGSVKVATSLKDVDLLEEGISTAAYKIAREALLNTERHAHAKRISVKLGVEQTADGQEVVCTISDDGLGFDARQERSHGHYGLVMMEEQAKAAGGVLLVQSEPGKGTRVSFRAPLLHRHSEKEIEGLS